MEKNEFNEDVYSNDDVDTVDSKGESLNTSNDVDEESEVEFIEEDADIINSNDEKLGKTNMSMEVKTVNNDRQDAKTTKNDNFKDSTKKYEEVEIIKSAKELRTDSYFDGKLLDLFGWKFLKNLISIVTLGIASPWGECMALNYEISNTVLNGKRLKFTGDGGSLFVERFKWILLSIITLGIYAFWIPVKKTKWILSNIYFEDEGYVRGESYFDGKVLQFVGINILCNFLNFASLFILYPFTECIRLRWIAKHSVINRKKVVFTGTGLGLFGHYLLWLFLTVITLGIYGLWLNIKLVQWKVKNSHLKLVGEEVKKDKSIIVMVVLFVILFVISLVVLASNPFEFDPSSFGPQQSGYQRENCMNGYCCDDYGNCCDDYGNCIDRSEYDYYYNNDYGSVVNTWQ